MQSKLSEVKVSEFELRILHRSMDGDGALIEIPVRATVVEWLIPEDETGPLMSYYEIVSATEEETGDPFDRHLITEAEFCESVGLRKTRREDCADRYHPAEGHRSRSGQRNRFRHPGTRSDARPRPPVVRGGPAVWHREVCAAG
jgi:hypothetical protein